MADFAKWSVAADHNLKLPEKSFLNAYVSNRDNVNETALEGLPLADTIKSFCDQTPEFQGTMKEFLAKLNAVADETKKLKDYPKTERGLRSKLERINPNLRAIGIDIKFLGKSDRGRMLELEDNRMRTSEPSESSENQKNGNNKADQSKWNSQLYSPTVSQSSANGHASKLAQLNGLASYKGASDDSDGCLNGFSENGNYCENCSAAVENYHDRCRSYGQLPLGI